MRAPVLAKTLCLALSTSLGIPSAVLAAPPPSSPGGDPSAMTPEQKLERAKQLFGEGLGALEAGDNATALERFEDAYYNYTPDKHKFNFNIGIAAYGVGDCVKARAAFQRFLDLVPEDPNRGEAQVKIMEIDRSGCANVAPPTTTTTNTTTAQEVDGEDDAPVLSSRSSARDEAIERELDEKESKRKSPLMITGALLTGLGAAGVIAGGVSVGLANKKANDLAALASPGPTGFPPGNYADDEVFDLDRNKLPRNNVGTVVFFVAGGALLVTGAALLGVYASQKKKSARKKAREAEDEEARVPARVRLTGVGPTLLPGGAGAGASLRF
ncbi:MAG: tetratricopeptide repeat protein [Deltaproteobacteria bacterium]|nr:tetratricopeptide repeat protein [Deltaproteobacteria bacterium]MBK8237708.1 tetratricopeptide repeat protein [Deltaproteobacteria bacterium]MBK8720079.1 tetratricopeptide repeat protein [Deltaproteobacteria bacterium]MBP7292032.1 tetratricopeptide repeat protein [Nannocystaceae bacterium]